MLKAEFLFSDQLVDQSFFSVLRPLISLNKGSILMTHWVSKNVCDAAIMFRKTKCF